ncbi:MAG TPA: hypothetical protein VK524_34390 [Polyangiaceae bacterium]|nr:hypothetical protein [Polyangiaceae bacterium]
MAVSCGRIGFDLLDPGGQPADASSGTGGTGGTGGTDASAGGSGGVQPPDASVDAPEIVDAAPEASDAAAEGGFPTCAVSRRWAFAFDSDPTAYDGDSNGVNDWIARGGGTFPIGELDSGVWRSTGGTNLDSRPLDEFETRTIVDVRMRSLTVPASTHGAVFWINLNTGASAFSALFVSLVLLPGGGQEATLFGKVDSATEVPIAVFPGLPEALVDFHLDIEPDTRTVAVWIDAVPQGRFSIPLTGPPNADHFATLLSWEGTSEFDWVDIVRCANL